MRFGPKHIVLNTDSHSSVFGAIWIAIDISQFCWRHSRFQVKALHLVLLLHDGVDVIQDVILLHLVYVNQDTGLGHKCSSHSAHCFGLVKFSLNLEYNCFPTLQRTTLFLWPMQFTGDHLQVGDDLFLSLYLFCAGHAGSGPDLWFFKHKLL